jgi:hypothetical protein
VLRLSRLQGHSAAGRIISIINSIDTIGNRTRDLPICNIVSQPTAPTREKRKDTGNLKRKQQIAMSGEIALEDVMDLS